MSKLLGEIEDIEDVAKEAAAKEAEKKTASNHKKNNKKTDKVKENKTAHMDAPGEVSDDTVTVISQGTTVNGGINSAGAVDVMGTINGDITSRGKVAINGTVTGNVSVQRSMLIRSDWKDLWTAKELCRSVKEQ